MKIVTKYIDNWLKDKNFHFHSETVGCAILPGHCLYGDTSTLYPGPTEKSRSTILN